MSKFKRLTGILLVFCILFGSVSAILSCSKIITYKVNVKDPDGNPISGISVQLNNSDGVVSEVESDNDGVATFTVAKSDDYYVTVTTPDGYKPNNVKYGFGSGSSIDIIMSVVEDDGSATAKYKVTVVDSEGVLLSNVAVRLNGASGVIATVSTDSNGVAEFEAEEDNYYITVTAPEGYDEDTTHYAFASGSTELTITLNKTVVEPTKVTYTVTVKDNKGNTVAGASVSLIDAEGNVVATVVTDASGIASFEVEEGDYTAKVTAPEGYDADDNSYDFDDDNKLTITLNETVVEPTKVTYTVTVKDNKGNTVAGASVSLIDDEGKVVATAVTDASGIASFEAEEGDYTAKVTAPEGYDADDNSYDFDDDNKLTVTLNETVVEPTKVTYTVTVKDNKGNTVAGASVSLIDAEGNVVATVVTDASGIASFEVEEGDYTAKVTAPEGYDADNNTYNFDDDNKLTITLNETVVEPTKVTYTVTVKDNKGNTVAGASVSLIDDEGKVVATAVTDASGIASFEAEEGDYTAKVTAHEVYNADDTSFGFDDNNEVSVILTVKTDSSITEGAGTSEEPYVLASTGDYTCYYVNGVVYYVYTATANGTFAVSSDSDNIKIVIGDGSASSLKMTKGDKVIIQISSVDESAAVLPFTLSFTEDESSFEGNGTKDDPYVLPGYGDYTAAFEGGDGFVWYSIFVTKTGVLTVTIDGDDHYIYLDGKTYSTASAKINVTANSTVLIGIATESMDAAYIDFTVSYAEEDIGSGTEDDPYKIKENGTYIADYKGGDCYVWYAFTLPGDGTFTVTVNGNDYALWFDGNKIESNTASVEAYKDATIVFGVAAGSYEAGSISFTVNWKSVYEAPDEPSFAEGSGTNEDPYVIPSVGGYTCYIDGTVYFIYTATSNGTLSITSSSSKLNVAIGDSNTSAVYMTVGDKVTIKLSTAGGTSATLPFNVSFTEDESGLEGSGTQNDPYVLPGYGDYKAPFGGGDGFVWYSITVTKTGKLTVTINGEDHYIYLDGKTYSTASATIDVTANSNILIGIATKSMEAAYINFTVSGAENDTGSGTEKDPYKLDKAGTYVADYKGGDYYVWYSFTLPSDGILKVTVLGDDYALWFDGNKIEGNTASVTAYKDATIVFGVAAGSYEAAKLSFTVAFDGDDEPVLDEGSGTEKDPYKLNKTGTYVADYKGGDYYVWYSFTLPSDGTLKVTVLGDDYALWFDGNKIEGNTASVTAYKDATIVFGVAAGSYKAGSISFTVTLDGDDEPDEPSFAEGSGTNEDPYVIPSVGNYTCYIDGTVYFIYTATSNGTLSITSSSDKLNIAIGDGNASSAYMTKGDKVIIQLSSADGLASDLPFTVSFTEDESGLEGSGTQNDPYVLTGYGDYTAAFEGGDGFVWYSIFVTKTGKLTVTINGDDHYIYLDGKTYSTASATIDVTANSNILIGIATKSMEAAYINFTVSDGEGSGDESELGTEKNPIKITENGYYTADYKGGDCYIWYSYTLKGDGMFKVTILGSDYALWFDGEPISGNTASVTAYAGTTVTFGVATGSYAAADVRFNVYWKSIYDTSNDPSIFENGSGLESDPYIVTMEDYVIDYEGGDCYVWLSYTAKEDGKLTVIINSSDYALWFDGEYIDANTASIDVYAGATIVFGVATDSMKAEKLSVTVDYKPLMP